MSGGAGLRPRGGRGAAAVCPGCAGSPSPCVAPAAPGAGWGCPGPAAFLRAVPRRDGLGVRIPSPGMVLHPVPSVPLPLLCVHTRPCSLPALLLPAWQAFLLVFINFALFKPSSEQNASADLNAPETNL